MRSTWWIAVSGALLTSGPALAGPGLPLGHDDTIYPDDLLEQAAPRRVDVLITDRGPEPRTVEVRGAEAIQLVFTRQSTRACRGDVLVPELDARTRVPEGTPVALRLLTHARGQLHVSCPMEDFVEAP